MNTRTASTSAAIPASLRGLISGKDGTSAMMPGSGNSVWLIPLFILCCITHPLSAAIFGKFTYTDNGTYITITDYPTTEIGAVEIPATIVSKPVTSIGDHAFGSCTGLTGVVIGNWVTRIGASAFYGCTGLKSVSIGTGVTSIGSSAFSSCISLTGVTIPGNVTSIGDNAFSHCRSLTSIAIPDSLTSIGRAVFSDCTGLTSVTIPNTITSIGDGAFSECSGLTNVTVPNSVTSFGYETFCGCTGLKSFIIPASVTSFGWQMFFRCTSLTTITVDALNSVYSSVDGVLFNKSRTTLVLYPPGRTGGYTIPSSVTMIGSAAFRFCPGLVSVTIPYGVTSIGSAAFDTCYGLTSVTIPFGVTSIGQNAFVCCSNLTSVSIPATVNNIGAYAFWYCSSLTSITIPESVTSIGWGAFSECGKLTSVIFMGNAPVTMDSSVFNSHPPHGLKVYYYKYKTGFTSPTWYGYPSAIVSGSNVFAGLELTCREREGIMDIVFDYLPTPQNTSPGTGNVRALYSLDGGTSWRPLRTATGDLGSKVPAGLGLVIKWDYAADGILTDPAYGSQIAIQLISTTPPGISEASTPAPNRVPVKPVRVNFCFGHAAKYHLGVKSWWYSTDEWVDAPSEVSDYYDASGQEAIRLETELIYRRAGVTAESMTFVIGPPQKPEAGKRVINVFFTPHVAAIWGICTPINDTGKRVDRLDRFGRKYREATAFIATERPGSSILNLMDNMVYHDPMYLAESVAHEVGHGLGMAHIEKQPTSQECIMDYTYGAKTYTLPLGGLYRAEFSHDPLLTTSDANGVGVNTSTEYENEMYYLLRWVEGIRIPYGLTPGEYDLENVSLTVVVSRSSSVNMSLAGAPDLYDVKVMSISADGESGTVVRKFPTLTAEQLLDFQLETGGPIQIIASSTPGGESDVAIVPEAQTDITPFSPVQGQAMKVLKYDALGVATNIGTGTTQSVTTSPIMPKDISVKPTGFDGAHVKVEFACEPGYQYTLERSDDCNSWTPVPALTNIPSSNEGRLSLLDENAGQEKRKLFYRVKVSMPVAP